MRKIPKRYAASVGVLGVISLLVGCFISIASFLLKVKINIMDVIENNATSNNSTHIVTDMTFFYSYWWIGLFYLIPGPLGIMVGCTKQRIGMFFFVIVNSVCAIDSPIVIVFLRNLLRFWNSIAVVENNSHCFDYHPKCLCATFQDPPPTENVVFSIFYPDCSELNVIRGFIWAIFVTVAIATVIAGLSLCVGSCGLWRVDIEGVAYERFGTSSQRNNQSHLTTNESRISSQQTSESQQITSESRTSLLQNSQSQTTANESGTSLLQSNPQMPSASDLPPSYESVMRNS